MIENIVQNKIEDNELLKEFYTLIDIFNRQKNKDINILHDIINIRNILDDEINVKYNEKIYRNIFNINNNVFEKWCDKIDSHNKEQIYELTKEKEILNKIVHNSTKVIKTIQDKNKIIINQEKINSNKFSDVFNLVEDEEFKKFIKNEFEKNKIFYKKIPPKYLPTGICHFNLSDSYTLYLVENHIQYSYMSSIIIIHELTHSYVYKKYGIDDDIFREVSPYYNEYKFMKILENNNLGLSDSILNYYLTILILKNNTIIKKILLNIDDVDYYKYLLGILVSFELFEMYLNDQEKGNYYEKKLLKNSKNHDIINQIKNANIDIEKLESGETAKKLVKKYDCLKNKGYYI